MLKFAVVLSFLSAATFGATGDAKRVCADVARGNSFLGQQCYQAIDRKLFEAGAVERCSLMTNSFLAIECLKAIALKGFTSDEISRCNVNNDFLVVECFKTAGQKVCR